MSTNSNHFVTEAKAHFINLYSTYNIMLKNLLFKYYIISSEGFDKSSRSIISINLNFDGKN